MGRDSSVAQRNEGGLGNFQKAVLGTNGNSLQQNENGAFYNIQFNQFSNGGRAKQINQAGSIGNVQINYGILGTQENHGFSSNLQVNLISCPSWMRNKEFVENGNVRLIKCVDSLYENLTVTYEGNLINFEIIFKFENDKFTVIDGNVFLNIKI